MRRARDQKSMRDFWKEDTSCLNRYSFQRNRSMNQKKKSCILLYISEIL